MSRFNRRFSGILTALVFLAISSFAQTTRKPFFQLPKTLGDFQAVSSLAPEFRSAVATALARNSCKLEGKEQYATAQIDIKGEGSITLIRIDDSCLCGPSGNCPMLALQKNKLVLSDAEGFSFALSPNPKGGTSDLLIASHTSAKVTALQRYQWKGGRFKLHDCEATVPKEDAISTNWNPEELEITSCGAIALK